MSNKEPLRENNIETLARWLDEKFTIPGTNIRFGLDPIIGLVPGAGDWLGGFISVYFLFQAVLAGGSHPVLVRMLINILLDIVIGAIPILGDVFDVAWKANIKNAALIKELESNPDKTNTQSRWFNWLLLIVFVAIILGLLVLLSWMMIEIVDWLFSLLS